MHFDLESIRRATKGYVEDVMSAKKGDGLVFINVMEKLTMNDPLGSLKARLNAALDAGIDGISLSAGLHTSSFGLMADNPRFRDAKLGIVVSLQTVTATAVSRAASEAVAHDNALYGAPLTVRDHAADLILRAGGTDNSAARHQHQRQQRQKQKTFHSPKMFKMFQKKCDCDTSRRKDSKNGVDSQVTDAPAGQ